MCHLDENAGVTDWLYLNVGVRGGSELSCLHVVVYAHRKVSTYFLLSWNANAICSWMFFRFFTHISGGGRTLLPIIEQKHFSLPIVSPENLPPRSISPCFLPSFNLSKIEISNNFLWIVSSAVLLQQSTSVSSNNKLSYNEVIPLFIILYIRWSTGRRRAQETPHN